MVDLAQQQLGAVAGGDHLAIGGFLIAAQALLLQRNDDRLGEQLEELALHILPYVVDGARLQRCDRHAAVLRAGDVDYGWCVGELADARQDFQAGLAGHVMIEPDDVKLVGQKPFETCRPR